MTNYTSSDEAWLEWTRVFAQAARMRTSGDTQGAMREIDQYLSVARPTDLRSDALSFRAQLHEDLGNLLAALQDLSVARDLLQSSPNFARYTIEITLGDICERLSQQREAIRWYIKALSTVAEDPLTSGGAALRRFASLANKEDLAEDEKDLVDRVATKSWRLLELQDAPDLEDLSKTANILLSREAQLGLHPSK